VFQMVAGDNRTPLIFNPPATTLGNTLIVVIALSTEAETVFAVNDNGGNGWIRAVIGENAASGRRGRIEIWYATGANPTTSVAVTTNATQLISANFTEWAGLALANPTLGSMTGGPGTNDEPRSGRLVVNQPALVIGASVVDDLEVTANLLDSPGFTAMTPFPTPAAADEVKGLAAYAGVPRFDGDVRWMLNAQQAWTGVIAAFRRMP
jgi:hypothetical protein